MRAVTSSDAARTVTVDTTAPDAVEAARLLDEWVAANHPGGYRSLSDGLGSFVVELRDGAMVAALDAYARGLPPAEGIER